MDRVKVLIWNLVFNSGRWEVTNYWVVRGGVWVTTLTRSLMSECEGNFSHVQLDALLLAPKMLTVLDTPTFKGSTWYEVPTRPHTVWCGSPIQYDVPVAIVLRICLNSCLSAEESGLLCVQEVRFVCLMSVIVVVSMVLSVWGEKGEGDF